MVPGKRDEIQEDWDLPNLRKGLFWWPKVRVVLSLLRSFFVLPIFSDEERLPDMRVRPGVWIACSCQRSRAGTQRWYTGLSLSSNIRREKWLRRETSTKSISIKILEKNWRYKETTYAKHIQRRMPFWKEFHKVGKGRITRETCRTSVHSGSR